MRKYLISLSIMVCLVIPGLVGNVCGQSDSLKQNHDSFMKILNKWEQDHDSINKIIYKWKQKPNLNLYPDIYQNNSYEYSYKFHKSGSSKVGIGTGIYYQWGFYEGEISNYITDHKTFGFFTLEFYYKKFVLQILPWNSGSCTVNSVVINGDTFTGNFFGEYGAINMAIGYEALCNSYISIIPNVGFQVQEFVVYVGTNSGDPLDDFGRFNYLLGLMADYKVNLINKYLHNNYVAIRFKYDYCFTGRPYQFYYGNMHQFAIGLTWIGNREK